MITFFEEITVEISAEEKELAEIILRQLKKRYNNKLESITGGEIVSRMKQKGFEISQPRLRKCINYLRQLSEPIIGTSNGYYYCENREDLIKQVISLEERAGAIMAAAHGIRKYLNYNPIAAELQTKTPI